MILEALLIQLSEVSAENNNLIINDSTAQAAGIRIDELRNLFYQETGRIILNNEKIKVHFDKEGGQFDFSTFDGVSVTVDFESQRVAPNKGGDGTEQ